MANGMKYSSLNNWSCWCDRSLVRSATVLLKTFNQHGKALLSPSPDFPPHNIALESQPAFPEIDADM
jgi:hypothetical protein